MTSGIDAKVAIGDLTVDVGQVIRNLTGVETDREKKSLLQKILEPKEVEDESAEIDKAKKIARKIARGESVTPQEKALLMRVDPKLAQMAELARKEYERIKHALQSASSKEEQQNIVHQAYQMVTPYGTADLPEQDGQQALLEQFFPEESLSIMECRG